MNRSRAGFDDAEIRKKAPFYPLEAGKSKKFSQFFGKEPKKSKKRSPRPSRRRFLAPLIKGQTRADVSPPDLPPLDLSPRPTCRRY